MKLRITWGAGGIWGLFGGLASGNYIGESFRRLDIYAFGDALSLPCDRFVTHFVAPDVLVPG